VFGRKWSRRAIIGSAVAVLVLIAAVALLRSRSGAQVAQVPFSDLLRHLDRGALAEVVVNGDTLDFKLRSGEAFRTTAPANYVTSNAAFVPELARRNVRLDVRTASEQSAYSYGALVLGEAAGLLIDGAAEGAAEVLDSTPSLAEVSPSSWPVAFRPCFCW